MIPVVLCKVSKPSVQIKKRKSYDENFVTAKCARINYGATLNLNLSMKPVKIKFFCSQMQIKLKSCFTLFS